MAELTIEQARDLGKITLNSFKRDQFEVTLAKQNYPMLNKLYSGDTPTQGGKLATEQITLGTTGNSGHTALFQKSETVIKNIQEEVQVPWTHAQSSFAYERREIAVNGGLEGFVKLMKVRRTNMYVELADTLESKAWSVPASASDKTLPFGISAWLTIGTSGQEGFVGMNPKYIDTNAFYAGSINADANGYERWRNYYADYDLVNDDLLKKLSRAFRKTNFQSPATVQDLVKGPLSNFKMFTNDAVLSGMEDLALKSDDAVGFDLGKYAGRVAYKRIPLDYAAELDNAVAGGSLVAQLGKDPIVGINFDKFTPIIMVDDRFRESDPINDRELPNVFTVFVDLSYAYICKNRREAGFVVSIV